MISKTVGLILVLVIALPSSAGAEVVETPAGSVTSVQLSLAMDNDWQFLGAECLIIPVLATYGRADNTSIIGELTVSKPSEPNVRNDATFLVLPGDPVAGQLLDDIFVCPADGTGEYRLSSVIRAIEPASEQEFVLDPLTFWVRPAVARMVKLSASNTKGGMRVTGSVRAGGAHATGIVEIRLRRPGSSRWILASRVPVERGNFASNFTKTLSPGTHIRATLTQCSWCSRASSTTLVS